MFNTIKPYAFGNILEIGSGVGNISKYFVQNDYSISLSDTDDFYIDTLKKKFSNNKNVKNILAIDLEAADFSKRYPQLAGQYDTVFFLNVLEHIEKDDLAVQNSRTMLKAGGKLIILVP